MIVTKYSAYPPSLYPKSPIPFDLAAASAYELSLHADDPISTIHIRPAIGHVGMQALDTYFSSPQGNISIPVLTVDDKAHRQMYWSRFGSDTKTRNALIPAVVSFDGNDTTTLGFFNDELPWGRELSVVCAQQDLSEGQASLLFIGKRVAHFLTQKAGAEVNLIHVPNC